MTFTATKHEVLNRGAAPDSFLRELVIWAQHAPEELFAPNDNPRDIYSAIKPMLGPWQSPLHRRAAMCEAMRVHAGLESSWSWGEGVDTTNKRSATHLTGQECGAFQVSFDSLNLDKSGKLTAFVTARLGTLSVEDFISTMKADHSFALSFYARLVRVSIAWAGPLILPPANLKSIYPWLRKDAATEFQALLA